MVLLNISEAEPRGITCAQEAYRRVWVFALGLSRSFNGREAVIAAGDQLLLLLWIRWSLSRGAVNASVCNVGMRGSRIIELAALALGK